MEKIGCGQAALRKEKKKKQAKDELERLKQAERKKRRLEKALATSAAIRSELEKKKQKKKEEQQRLDEEGAAIAEAVALHVLLGEDSDDSCQIMLNSGRKVNPWGYSGDIGLFMDSQNIKAYEGQGGVSNAYGSGCKYNNWGIGWPMTNGIHGIGLQVPYVERTNQTAEISAGLIAAQALSSLRIADDSQEDQFIHEGAAAAVINRMLGDSALGTEVNLCGDF
uniref:Radixin n=1 Tax=Anthurium amnicola TaxID=1678845 RepID=A0A1D1XRC8_9ARAE